MQSSASPLSLTLSPDTVYITATPGQSSFANFTITVTNNGADALLLTNVGILLPSNLYQPNSLGSVSAATGQPAVWNFEAQSTEGAFVATPANGSNTSLAGGASFTFTLANVTLAQQTGAASITIKAKIQDSDPVIQNQVVNLELSTASIIFFNAQPSDIGPGESATLSWDTTGIDYCIVSPVSPSQQPASGSLQVTPNSTTAYTLNAYASGIILAAQWEVLVENPRVISFGGDNGQTSVNYGESIKLVWECNQFTERIELSSDNTNLSIPAVLPVNGRVIIGPLCQATNFEITAYAGSSPNSCFTITPAQITVNAPTATFTASHDTAVWQQDEVTITWEITSAATVSITPALPGGPSLQSPGGSVSIQPTEDINYTLTVTGAPETEPVVVTLSVNLLQVVINSFYINPNWVELWYDGNPTIGWDTLAQVVSIDQGVGPVATSGTITYPNPANTMTFTLTAGTLQNPNMQQQTITYTVNQGHGPE